MNQSDENAEVKPKPEKSRREKMKAQRKAIRNRQKKLERAATLNCNEEEIDSSIIRDQGTASANPSDSSSSGVPEALKHAIGKTESSEEHVTAGRIAIVDNITEASRN